MRFLAVVFALCVVLSASKPVAAQNCALCEYVIQAVEGWVEQNSTVSEIETYLNKLCTLVPGFSSVCDAIANEGIEEVIALIQQYGNAQAVCTQLGVCTSAKTAPKPAVSGTDCAICETVISSIESWIASSQTQAEMVVSLDKLCQYVPGFSVTCDAIVEAGLPTVISWINTYENSTVVCEQLHVCSAAAIAKQHQEQQQIAARLGDSCSNCQTLISTMEDWLAKNATESWIEDELMKFVCVAVPSFEETCDAIFKYGVPDTVNWIELYENPQTVCAQLGLCTATAPKITPINHGKIKLTKLVLVN
jgi:saposin